MGPFSAQKADNPRGVRTVRTPFGLSAFWAGKRPHIWGPVLSTKLKQRSVSFRLSVFFFCRILYRPVVADMDSSCTQLCRLMLCWSSSWNGSGTFSHTVCRESEVHRVVFHDLVPRSRFSALHHVHKFVDPWNSSLSMAPMLGCAVAAPRRCHFNRDCIRRCPGRWNHHRCIWCAVRC